MPSPLLRVHFPHALKLEYGEEWKYYRERNLRACAHDQFAARDVEIGANKFNANELCPFARHSVSTQTRLLLGRTGRIRRRLRPSL